MTGPVAARSRDGARLHLQHGPIDLIIGAEGDAAQVEDAYAAAWERFQGVLDELVSELPALRSPVAGPDAAGATRPAFAGRVARRMDAAASRVAEAVPGVFVTRMAAVAGSVADEILAVMLEGRDLSKAYVNDGGDIALHLSGDATMSVGLVPVPDRPEVIGRAVVHARDPVRGVATSGRHGRSFSLGIADAVTALATDAATADVAATLIANAVDLPSSPKVHRTPASDLEPDTDLGDRPVVTGLDALGADEVDAAIAAGVVAAERMRALGLIVAAVLCLDDRVETVGRPSGASS